MKMFISSFENGAIIPNEFAFGIPDKKNHIQLGENKNPNIQWSEIPQDARSLTLICVDPDVPSEGTHVNKENETVSKNLPRVNFFHWVLVDINPKITEIKIGEISKGITTKGKPIGKTHFGITGINDYTHWFANDPEMSGNYGDYDGPCPPWNDELPHRYFFRLYALNVDSLGLNGAFDGNDVLKAMENKIIDQAEWMGVYSLNPKVRAALADKPS